MKKILFLTSFLLLGLMSCQSQSAEKNADDNGGKTASSYEDIGVEAFKEKLAEPGIVLIDVRTPEEIAEGKIEGAMELNYYDDNFGEELGKLDKDKIYLIYCRSGNRSGKACKLMQEQGFSNLYNLEGGYLEWSKQQ